jgi:DNA-binding NarL/FixJ family response regulator
MQKIIRIIHADDHELVRYSVKSLINKQAPHIQFVGEAASYPELLAVLIKTEFDLFLLDGEIIGGSTSEYLPKIRELYPNMKIILLWIFADADSLTKWIHLLDGHLNLGANSEGIIYAIDSVMRSERYFTMPVFHKHRNL